MPPSSRPPAIVGALGISGVASAQASSDGGGQSPVEHSDGDGEHDDSTEVENEGKTNDDANDEGPDADRTSRVTRTPPTPRTATSRDEED